MFDYELCETLSDIPTFTGVDLHEYTSLPKGKTIYLPRTNATPLEKRKIIKIHQTIFLRILDQEQHKVWIIEVPNHLYRLRDDENVQIAANINEKTNMWIASAISQGVYEDLDLIEEALEGISIFNESTEVVCREILTEYTELVRKNNSPAVNFKSFYKISVIDLTQGSLSLPVALISRGLEPVHLGAQDVYLQPISEDTKKLLKDKPIYKSAQFREGVFRKQLLKMFAISDKFEGESESTKDVTQLWDEFLDICYELTLPVPKDELQKCKNINKVCEMAITGGLTLDPKLIMGFCAQVPLVNPNSIEPEEVMPYVSHGLNVTNSKTGKSSTASRISPNVIRDPTPSNLLGYSSIDKNHQGLLHNQIHTTFIDELTESLDPEVANGLSNYMETGITHRARGEGIKTRGYSALVFLGNPKVFDRVESTTDTYEIFEHTLQYATGNPTALGSRLGWLLFNSSLKTVKGQKLESKTSKNSLKVLKSIQLCLRDKFSMLFKNSQIIKWLDQPFPDEYIAEIRNMSQNIPLATVREFFKGTIDAYRHARGTALRIVFYQNFERYIMDEDPTPSELLEECEDQFIEVCELNLDSMRKIASVKIDESILKGMVQRTPEYIQLFLTLFAVYNKDGVDRVPLDNLEEDFLIVRQDEGKYGRFSALVQNLMKNIKKTNMHLERFGIELTTLEDITLVKVIDLTEYKRFESLLKNNENCRVREVRGVFNSTDTDNPIPSPYPPYPHTLDKTQGTDKTPSEDHTYPMYSPYPEISIKEIVLRTIIDSKMNYPEGVPIHHIIKIAEGSGYKDHSVVKATLEKLKQQGQIFEPRTPDVYKYIG